MLDTNNKKILQKFYNLFSAKIRAKKNQQDIRKKIYWV